MDAQEELLQAVQGAGFEARLLGSGDASAVRLRLGGMTCGACSAAIEGALRGTEGVHQASVSLLTSTAEVRYLPQAIPTGSGVWLWRFGPIP